VKTAGCVVSVADTVVGQCGVVFDIAQ
jgi:hypothetical protein